MNEIYREIDSELRVTEEYKVAYTSVRTIQLRQLLDENQALKDELDKYRQEAKHERELSESIVAEREELIVTNQALREREVRYRQVLEYEQTNGIAVEECTKEELCEFIKAFKLRIDKALIGNQEEGI